MSSESYHNSQCKRPYAHWVERAQLGSLESLIIRWPKSFEKSFYGSIKAVATESEWPVINLPVGRFVECSEMVMKSQIYDLAEARKHVINQAFVRELSQMLLFRFKDEAQLTLSEATQSEGQYSVPRELNPLFIERKFEYTVCKSKPDFESFLKSVGASQPGPSEYLMTFVIFEILEAAIRLKDKFSDFKIYLQLPADTEKPSVIKVIQIDDYKIESTKERTIEVISATEDRQPYLGEFYIKDVNKADSLDSNLVLFADSEYLIKDKLLTIFPPLHNPQRIHASAHTEPMKTEGHYNIYKQISQYKNVDVARFRLVAEDLRYGLSLETLFEDNKPHSLVSFWTEFSINEKKYKVANFPENALELLSILTNGISSLSEKDRKDLAFYRKGLKRDNDLKILKHQGVAALILLESCYYSLKQPLTSGIQIDNDDDHFFDVVENNIFELFRNSIFTDKYGEQPLEAKNLKDYLSDKVYDFLIYSIKAVLKLIKYSRMLLALPEGVVQIQNCDQFVAEFILTFIDPIMLYTRGDLLTKNQTKNLDFLDRFVQKTNILDENQKKALPVFENDNSSRHLQNAYVHQISISDVYKNFIYNKIGELAGKNWSIFIDNIPLEQLGEDDLTSEISLSGGKSDWFELSPKIFFKGQMIRIEDIQNMNGILFYRGRPYIIDPKSLPRFALLESFWERLKKEIIPTGQGKEKEFVRVPRSAILELLSLADAGTPIVSDNPYWNEIYNFYKNLGKDEQRLKLPTNLESILKDYQKIGVQWVSDLYNLQLGGILADDMGLGKTLQALTFLNQHRLDGHKTWSLVVVPTSLCFNWENEARKFTPELDVEVFNSSKKATLFKEKTDQHRLIVVTYGLLTEHESFFADFNWDIVIFDEAQNLKNISSKRTSSSRLLKAKFKLALSGTPLENNYMDFYSLSDLVLPGSLGTYRSFIENFGVGKAIENEAIQHLKKKIKPIVLRRTKSSVNLNLPEKTEESLRLDFSQSQMDIYKKLALSHNEQISQMIKDYGESKSQLAMLTALLRLRQVCSDPSGIPQIDYTEVPPKLSYIMDCMKEHLEEGRSVIVFTQFLATLQHLSKLFDQHNVPYFTIHGSVTAKVRSHILDKFQNTETPQVLLMTLKTGGVGLNLTKASVVYHIEPWWNPAVENQATDRVHRLGQQKDISVYRLIMKDSVEEKIEILKTKKKKYFDSLFSDAEIVSNSEDSTTGGYLSADDFKYLLGM